MYTKGKKDQEVSVRFPELKGLSEKTPVSGWSRNAEELMKKVEKKLDVQVLLLVDA